jgi:hypothetical protein
LVGAHAFCSPRYVVSQRGPIIRLATDLGEDPDVLLVLTGRVGSDLQAIILRKPKQFAELTTG